MGRQLLIRHLFGRGGGFPGLHCRPQFFNVAFDDDLSGVVLMWLRSLYTWFRDSTRFRTLF